MRATAISICVFLALSFSSCDLRSGTAKEEMEKFEGGATSTPVPEPSATEEPVDPADVVEVRSDQKGPQISIDGYAKRQKIECSAFNDVFINGVRHEIDVSGPCSHLTINGDNNKVELDAAVTITVNGDGNKIEFMRVANGKRPFVTDRGSDNSIDKVAFLPAKGRKANPSRGRAK
jgi:hypothetical protein